MKIQDQRLVIYAAVALLCAVAAMGIGAAAAWSFLQVLAVIELVQWFGAPARDYSSDLSAK